MADSTEFLHAAEEDEHIVRRLGAAAVSLWPTLPPDVQEALLQKSLSVLDKYQTVQLDQQIRGFIEKNAGKR